MRRESISVIDHLKCGPLFQQRNVLAQRRNILTYSSSPATSPREAILVFFPTFTPFLFYSHYSTFKVFFTFPIILLSVHPYLCLCVLFPQLCPFLLFPCTSQKQVLYVSTQWPNEGVWVQTEGQKGKIKKTTRQKRGEIGRKAWHQEGFSLVKQEVWETKGQKEELFQSVTPLSHCFHCVLAVMFAFMSGINKLQRIDVLCWLNGGIWEFSLALMIHLAVVTVHRERAPRWCPGDDKLWNTPPSCLQTVHK